MRSRAAYASVAIWLVLAPAARADEPARSTTLQGILSGKGPGMDPAVAQLEAAWQELAERPLAKTAGKPGLDRARQELTRLHQLIADRAHPQAIERRKQLVWAALSLSDREMARAELAAALQTALLRREQAEQQLKAAKNRAPESAK